MSSFVKYLNTAGNGILSNDIIVKAIVAHYYLSEIHPFGDGNGRTARALEALILYVNGINEYCFWSLASFWSSNRDKYLVHLDNIRNNCNPLDFVLWGLKGYRDEIKSIKRKVLTKVKQLMLLDYAKYKITKKKIEKIKINQRIVDVLKILVKTGNLQFNKFQNSPEVLALFSNVSSTTRWRDYKKMADLGLVSFYEENNKIYIKPDYQILERIRYNL